MKFTAECRLGEDGRWLAEVPQLDGVVAYGDSEVGALAKAQALALRVLAEQLEAGSCAPCDISMAIVRMSNESDVDQAAYDAWLAAEVQEALDDDSPTMSTEEVMRYVRASEFVK